MKQVSNVHVPLVTQREKHIQAANSALKEYKKHRARFRKFKSARRRRS